MRHKKANAKINLKSSHRMSQLRNLASDLLMHGAIVTTVATAKVLRAFIEPLITRARNGNKINHLTSLRRAVSVLHSHVATKKLFDVVLPKIENRNGGYLRIIKLGYRKGDSAPVARIEFVDKL